MALSSAAASSRPQREEPIAATLLPGIEQAHALAAGETRRLAVEVGDGAYWRVVVTEENADVRLRWLGGDGTMLVAQDGPLPRRDVLTALMERPPPGRHFLEIVAKDGTPAAGRFRVRVDRLQSAGVGELRAEMAETRAGAEYFRDSPESKVAARSRYEEALRLWRSLADPRREAQVLDCLAALSKQAGEPSTAIERYEAAVALWRRLDDPRRLAGSLNDLGLTHWQQRELDRAASLLDEARAIYDDLGLEFGRVTALSNRCMVTHAGGDLRGALPCYEQAIEGFHGLGELQAEATALNNLGFAFYSLGEPAAAIDHYGRSLAIRQTAGDALAQTQSLNNLAVVYRDTGSYGEAIAHYAQVRELLRQHPDVRREAAVLSNLGVLYRKLGELERARDYFRQALDLRRKIEDRRGQGETLGHLGELAEARSDPEAALEIYAQGLDLVRLTEDRRAEGRILTAVGRAELAAGRPDEALTATILAADVLRALGDRHGESLALSQQADALLTLARPADALKLIGRALATLQAVGDLGEMAHTTFLRARAHRDLGHLDVALRDIEAAVDAADSTRARVGSSALRASYLATQQDLYGFWVDLLVEQHRAGRGSNFARQAWVTAERARARSLFELMNSSGPGASRVSSESTARRAAVERELRGRLDRRLRLARRESETPLARELDLAIEELIAELEDLEESEAGGRVSDLGAAELDAVQAALGPDTLLLEYWLGTDSSLLWLVSKSGLEMFELPADRAAVEAAARAVHAAFSTPGRLQAEERWRVASALSSMLLGQVAGRLDGRQLLIAPYGALNYVPFAALPRPGGEGPEDGGTWRPLAAEHEVTQIPSADVWLSLRRRSAPLERRLLVVADAVFGREDPRVRSDPAASDTVVRTLPPYFAGDHAEQLERGLESLQRLTYSRTEAERIVEAAAGQVDLLLDFDVSLEAILELELSSYGTLHFATHGLVDATRPELSGLVVSLVDSSGTPRPGFLGLRDIQSLDLDADLVVLSACSTALGREVTGEGLVGLSQAFFQAGARRVLASLWSVNDRATSELMARFYRAAARAGATPQSALREAQLSMLREKRYADPYYWAGFLLQGLGP